MDIIWYGGSCFRLRSGSLNVLTDPFDLPSSIPPLSADVVTLSRRSARDRLHVQGSYRLVDGPGDYEIKGVPIIGVSAYPRGETQDEVAAPERTFVYTLTFDNVVVSHLGRLAEPPASQALQQMGQPDVVLLPLGRPEGLLAADAVKLASQLEAKLLIPMTLGGADDQGALERFRKELAADDVPALAQITVTQSGLSAQPKVALLAPQAAEGAAQA